MNAPVLGNLPFSDLSLFGVQAAGRRILADADMLAFLQKLEAGAKEPSSKGYHALAVINAVNSLRSSAVPVNSYVRNGQPSSRCITGPGFEIRYELNVGLSQTDITITDIRMVKQSVDEISTPALWNVKSGGKYGRWVTSNDPVYSMAGSIQGSAVSDIPIKVGINGLCADIEDAAAILPSHIARGQSSVEDNLRKTGYQLFYVPQSGAVKAGWQFVRDLGRKSANRDVKQAGQILAGYMIDAHQQGLQVEWTSHRGGSAVLTEAMRCLQNQHINVEGKQRIFLSDHTSSHYEADLVRRAIGMDTRDSVWFNATPGVAQLVGGQTLGTATIACSLTKLLRHTPKDQLVGETVETAYDIVLQSKNALALGGVVIALGTSPAQALALVGTAVVGTALASVPSLNNDYHSSPITPLKRLANNIYNKVV